MTNQSPNLEISFDKLASIFQEEIISGTQFKVIEICHSPYLFGSGYVVVFAYSNYLRLAFDGKENSVDISIATQKSGYPKIDWKSIYWVALDKFDREVAKQVVQEILQRNT